MFPVNAKLHKQKKTIPKHNIVIVIKTKNTYKIFKAAKQQ